MASVAAGITPRGLRGGHQAIARGADWLVSPVNGLVSVALFALTAVALRGSRGSRQTHAH